MTREQVLALVDYCPYFGIFTCRMTGRRLGYKNGEGYVRLKLLGRSYAAHRLAWFLTYGSWPVGVIDHINRVRDDNWILNLRDVSRAENNRNQSPPRPRRKRPGGTPWIAEAYAVAVKKNATAFVKNLTSVAELPRYGK